MRSSVGALMSGQLYAFVYSAEGAGKTCLAMTLADANGRGVAFVTAERSGTTSLASLGYPLDIPVEVIDPGVDPFGPAVTAITAFTADRSVRAICIDGLTVIVGNAVAWLSGGEGEKSLGHEGWQRVLAGCCRIETACSLAIAAGKSVLMTAWEREPEYTTIGRQRVLTSEGRPMLPGQAKVWLPGKCDIVARLTSKNRLGPRDPKTGTAARTFERSLQVYRDGLWLAKTRWELPSPCPADLAWILAHVTAVTKKAHGGTEGTTNNGARSTVTPKANPVLQGGGRTPPFPLQTRKGA